MDPERFQRLKEFYGLDKPWYVQYERYVTGVARFDFGPSLVLRDQSVNDIVRTLASLGDGDFGADYAPARKGEVQHIALDFSRAREELGWEPKVTLEEGLRRTLDSLR